MLTGVAERVRELAARALESGDVELVDVDIRGAGRSRIVTVTIDKPGGVSVEDCAAASTAISAVFEDEDPISGPYRLEVQSPGLERPLRTPEEFSRAVGMRVSVKREGHQPLVGDLVSASAVTIVVSGEGEVVEVDIDDIVRARTVLEWGGDKKPRENKRGKSR